jgi:hypothetical protein
MRDTGIRLRKAGRMNRRSIIRAGAAVGPVAIFLAVYSLYWPPDVPLIGPDSPSYLDFHAIRNGGYPFFLSVLKLIFADRSHYVIAQYTLYGLSVLLFAWQLLKIERNLLFCLIVEVGLLANWEVNRFHFTLITETLFLSIGVSFLAAALAHLRTGSSPPSPPPPQQRQLWRCASPDWRSWLRFRFSCLRRRPHLRG